MFLVSRRFQTSQTLEFQLKAREHKSDFCFDPQSRELQGHTKVSKYKNQSKGSAETALQVLQSDPLRSN